MAASALVALVLPRFLGDANLGKFAFASAYTTYFLLATNLGITTHLTKEIARNEDLAGSYTANTIYFRLPMAILAVVLGVALINIIGADPLTKKTIYIMFFGMVLTTVYDIILASLQGLQQMRPIAISNVIVKVSFGASAAVLLISGYGLLEVAAASAISVAAGLAVPLIVLIKRSRSGAGVKLLSQISMNAGVWKMLLIGGLPFFVWQASLVIYGKVDMLMLGIFTEDAVIGWYAAAYRLTSLHTFIPAIVMTATLPALVSAANSDDDSFRRITRRAFQIVVVGTLPIAAGTLLLADRFIDVFEYPSEFSHSVPLVIILALHSPLVAADMIIGTALVARDRQKQWAMTGVAAAVLNPSMNAVLIPLTQSMYGNGAIGAAIATLVTEFFMMGMGLWLLPRGILGWNSFRLTGRALAAAGAMAVVVTILRDQFIVIPVAAGALAYVSSAVAFRAVHIDDLRRAWSYIAARRRGKAGRAASAAW